MNYPEPLPQLITRLRRYIKAGKSIPWKRPNTASRSTIFGGDNNALVYSTINALPRMLDTIERQDKTLALLKGDPGKVALALLFEMTESYGEILSLAIDDRACSPEDFKEERDLLKQAEDLFALLKKKDDPKETPTP